MGKVESKTVPDATDLPGPPLTRRRTRDLMYEALLNVMRERGYIDITLNEPWDISTWKPAADFDELADDLAEAFFTEAWDAARHGR